MARNFWSMVNQVISRADVLIEVLDARVVDESRNLEVERKIDSKGKRLIIVINKCDLAEKEFLDRKKKELGADCIFVSTKEHFGLTMLKKKLLECARGAEITVGMLGYPNTGKSSVINALKGMKAAPTSSVSGYTRSIRLVRVHRNLMLIDTPGVFPYGEKDETLHAMMSAKNPSQIKDPDVVAMKIIEMMASINPSGFEKYYGQSPAGDPYEVLERLALDKKKLRTGGTPDVDLIARMIITDWQKGKIILRKD
ncbi:GTPase [Candidatus Woesearchaeota archaeon CG08_land_8_20_14_0_20_43_7]|nr:MAG: GTPase [Candidatus Woesearchaeota archaeon CG08_land_8_20_14_0_20_43_7]